MITAPLPESHIQQLEQRVSALCNSVMVAVAAGIRNAKRKPRDLDQVVAVMREELKAFVFGDSYAAEREAVLMRSMHDGWIVAAIAAQCIGRIEFTE
jgi:hypothetical protein